MEKYKRPDLYWRAIFTERELLNLNVLRIAFEHGNIGGRQDGEKGK